MNNEDYDWSYKNTCIKSESLRQGRFIVWFMIEQECCRNAHLENRDCGGGGLKGRVTKFERVYFSRKSYGCIYYYTDLVLFVKLIFSETAPTLKCYQASTINLALEKNVFLIKMWTFYCFKHLISFMPLKRDLNFLVFHVFMTIS